MRVCMLDKQLTSKLRVLFQFHVYFTIRRIIIEMPAASKV